jgi:hypothetical protein
MTWLSLWRNDNIHIGSLPVPAKSYRIFMTEKGTMNLKSCIVLPKPHTRSNTSSCLQCKKIRYYIHKNNRCTYFHVYPRRRCYLLMRSYIRSQTQGMFYEGNINYLTCILYSHDPCLGFIKKKHESSETAVRHVWNQELAITTHERQGIL